MLKRQKLCTLLILVSVNIYARPYGEGLFEDEIGKYDNQNIKVIVEEASKVCINLLKGDFIIKHWLYKPNQDEVFLTGRTREWFFYKEAQCSYRPSNQSAGAIKFPRGFNILGKHEDFKTNNY